MERKHLESAAANYSYLRGLLAIPVGFVLILAGLTNMEWGPLSDTWVFLAAMPVAGVAFLGITRYYNEHYGRVTPSRKQQVRAVVATVFSLVVVVAGIQSDWSLDLPVNGTAAAFALIMLAYYAVTTGVRAHHTIIWGSLLVTGLLPAWGNVSPDTKTNVGLLAMGAATIATGVFDHLALRRSFGPPNGLSVENSNAGA